MVVTGWGGPDTVGLGFSPDSHRLAQPLGASPFASLGLSDLISEMGTVVRRKPSLYLMET